MLLRLYILISQLVIGCSRYHLEHLGRKHKVVRFEGFSWMYVLCVDCSTFSYRKLVIVQSVCLFEKYRCFSSIIYYFLFYFAAV